MDTSKSARRIDIAVGNQHRLASGILLLVVFAGSIWLFESIWRRDVVANLTSQIGGWGGAILVVILSAVLHELIHFLGWKVGGGVAVKDLSLRPTWRKLGFRAQLHTAIPATVYRLGVILPALVLGAMPLAYSLLTGNGLLLLWALFFILECFSDVTVIFAIASLPSNARVLEHEHGWHVGEVPRDAS